MTASQLTQAPLTREDRVKIIDTLRAASQHRGELLLPDDELYPTVFDAQKLEIAGKKILVWLGVKPRNLTFEIAATSGFDSLKIPPTISLTPTSAVHCFSGTALLAKACLEYFFYRNNQAYDEELLELASIEFGLGLIFINSINSGPGFRDRINRIITTRKPSVDVQILSYHSIEEYVRLFRDFTSVHELHPKVIWEHTLPWAKRYGINPHNVIGQFQEESYVKATYRQRRHDQIKVVGLASTIALVLLFVSFLYVQVPKKLTVDLQAQKEKIELLRQSYQACSNSIETTRDSQTTSDIFAVQQLDSEISRCNSLRNKHDYEVRDFNTKLHSLGLE